MSTTYAWPTGREWEPHSTTVPVLMPNVREFTSQYSGAYQTIDRMGERFKQTLRLGPLKGATRAAARQAYFNKLRGANFIAAHCFRMPAPNGTQRGTPTLNAAVAQGALTLPLANCTNGATLLSGDILGIGGEWFMVADAITFSGTTGTVNVCNRVRNAAGFSSGAAVTWDKPITTWRVSGLPVEVLCVPGQLADGVEVELIQI